MVSIGDHLAQFIQLFPLPIKYGKLDQIIKIDLWSNINCLNKKQSIRLRHRTTS